MQLIDDLESPQLLIMTLYEITEKAKGAIKPEQQKIIFLFCEQCRSYITNVLSSEDKKNFEKEMIKEVQ